MDGERRWGKAKACPERSRRGGNLFRRSLNSGALITILFLVAVILGCGGATPTATPLSSPTSTPLPALTPTPTATPAPTPLPKWPLIRLRHDGQVYSGEQGNSCWPVNPLRPRDKVCGDERAEPWEIVDTATGKSCPSGASWCGTAVPVPMGDSIMVEIDADDQPKGLQVAIYDNASRAYNDPPAQVLKLETGFTAPFGVDVPAGTYYLRISGQWDEGGGLLQVQNGGCQVKYHAG